MATGHSPQQSLPCPGWGLGYFALNLVGQKIPTVSLYQHLLFLSAEKTQHSDQGSGAVIYKQCFLSPHSLFPILFLLVPNTCQHPECDGWSWCLLHVLKKAPSPPSPHLFSAFLQDSEAWVLPLNIYNCEEAGPTLSLIPPRTVGVYSVVAICFGHINEELAD